MRARSDLARGGGIPDARRLRAIVVAGLGAVVLAWVTSLAPPTARADGDAAPPSPRFVLCGPVPDALALRIDGHTGDLDWTATHVDATGADTSLAARFALATEHDARVVVWVDVEVDELVLYLVDVEARRLFVRHFDRTIASDSVVFEEVGVVVRSTLVALSLGADVGRAVSEEEMQAPEPEPEPAPETAVAREGPRWGFEGGLSASWLVHDVGTLGHLGPRLRLGARTRRALVGVELADGLRTRVRAGGVALDVSRLELGVVAGYALARRARVSLALLGRVGAAFFRRATVSANGATPTSAETGAAFVAGAELRGLVLLDRRERVGLALSLGVDALAHRPEYVVRDASLGTTTRVTSVSVVAPRLELGLVVRAPPLGDAR